MSSSPATELLYHLAGPNDLPLLLQLREECGWGTQKLLKYWGDKDRPLCIFSLDVNGKTENVGMGGWILEDPEDLEAACRATGTVTLSEIVFFFFFQPREVFADRYIRFTFH
jgi:hypothetical protein